MDTFEKIRALLAEQLDVDRQRDHDGRVTSRSDFRADQSGYRGYGDDAGGIGLALRCRTMPSVPRTVGDVK